MCGRFTLRTGLPELQRFFEFAAPESTKLPPRYNIAPTQQIAALRKEQGERTLVFLKWGLVPSWAADAKTGNPMINARGETVSEKPFFRSAFKKRRCLILADGFIEWRRPKTVPAAGKDKQPLHIRMKDQSPFGMAGLYERWEKGETPLETCAIITTGPNDLMTTIHDRMPVILDASDFDKWLDPDSNAETLQLLLRPFPAEALEAAAISKAVNNARNDSPECLEETPVQTDLFPQDPMDQIPE